MAKNSSARTELARQYGNKCMLTEDGQSLTYHHIDKEANGGPRTVENGALMSDSGQRWLHNNIERNEPELFDLINECLLLYKRVVELGELTLLQQYRDEVIPLFKQAVWEYNGYQNPTHRKQKKLVKKL